jgi:hypothetical protein
MIRGFAKVILWHKVYVVHCIAYVQIYISTLSKKKSNDFTKKYNIQIVEKKKHYLVASFRSSKSQERSWILLKLIGSIITE